MEEIWIIGAGQFGRIAFDRLSKGPKKRHFVLVDPVKEKLLRCQGPHVTREKAEGVEFVERNLRLGSTPEWIIPALPVHLAAEWFLLRLGPDRLRRTRVPPEMEALLPNPIRGSDGNLYVSHATFRCPDDCAEPADACSVTGKPRGQNMFEILGHMEFPPFQSLVIRSHQLGPGIGGYRAGPLFDLLKRVERSAGRLLVSTACRCHGVITAMERL